jgi:hypothetical protein
MNGKVAQSQFSNDNFLIYLKAITIMNKKTELRKMRGVWLDATEKNK